MRFSQHAEPQWATVSSTRPRTWNKEQACYYVEQYHGMLHRELWICFGSFEDKRNQEELYKWYTKLYSETSYHSPFSVTQVFTDYESSLPIAHHDVSPPNLILNNFKRLNGMKEQALTIWQNSLSSLLPHHSLPYAQIHTESIPSILYTKNTQT